jgi:hypothetical protein
VGDAGALYEFHRANGVDVVEEIADREYGIRDYKVKDLYGYHSLGYLTYEVPGRTVLKRTEYPKSNGCFSGEIIFRNIAMTASSSSWRGEGGVVHTW